MFSGAAISGQDKTFEEYKSEIISLGKEKKFDEALIVLEEAKKKFPEERHFQASIYYNVAYGYYTRGELGRALSILDQVSKEYSFYDPIWALYARTLIKSGKKDKAFTILGRYPNNQDSFIEDLNKKKLNVWTTYNLAGAYALFNNSDLALLYLSTLFSVEGFDPKSNFSNVEKDPDFNLLRADRRYVHLKDLAFAETFMDALEKIRKELAAVQTSIQEFKQGKSTQSETLGVLHKSKQNLFDAYIVAPNLVEIQKKLLFYITDLEGIVSGKKQLPWEKLQESYRIISNLIKLADASQTTGRKL